MKKISSLFVLLLSSFIIYSQSYNITWGEAIKLKKGTSDLDIVTADNTGLYFTEARVKVKSAFLVGATYGNTYKLYKVDKNFSEVFDKEYKKELRGLEFHSFQTLGDDIYLFVTDYDKRDRLFKVLGAKIDKSSGNLVGDFTELGSYQLEDRKDNYEMKVTPIRNGTSFLMVSNVSAKDRVSLGISVLDKDFHKKESTLINLSVAPGEYSLQDVKITADNKIVLLGKEFQEVPYKKKRTRLAFKQYSLAIYDITGKKEKDISLETGDRFVINGRFIEQTNGELLLAGFYSNSSRKDDLNGFFINKINVQKGELTVSSFKEINSGMLGKSFVDDADDDNETKESKKLAAKAKDDDEEDDLPNEYIIRSVDINPVDNSIIITGEVSQYSTYTYATNQYNNGTRIWETTWHRVHRFTNDDILIINADKDGNIRWLNDIPKAQVEEVRTSNTVRSSMVYFSSDIGGYFELGAGIPYYSSYISFLNGKNLVIMMNDHVSNNVNAEYGTRVRSIYNFRKKSNLYGITIDLASGKMIRKSISSNNEDAVLMPRLGFPVKNELILPSWRLHALAKTEFKIAKVVVK